MAEPEHIGLEEERRHLSWRYIILTVTLALISGGPAFLMAWNASNKAGDAAAQSQETHKAVNSRLDEFMKTYKQAAGDAALLKERKEVKDLKEEHQENLSNEIDYSKHRKKQ